MSAPLPDPDSGTAAAGPVNGAAVRRVASADVLGTMQDFVIVEEPEALQTPAEKHDDINDEGDDDDVPRWAQRGGFTDGELPHAHALLVAFFPASFLAHLPTSPDRMELLCPIVWPALRRIRRRALASAAANPEGMIELEPE